MTWQLMAAFGLYGLLVIAFLMIWARHVDMLHVLKMRVKSLEAYILDVDHKRRALRIRVDHLGQEYSQKYADAERDMIDAMGGFELGEQLSDNEKIERARIARIAGVEEKEVLPPDFLPHAKRRLGAIDET